MGAKITSRVQIRISLGLSSDRRYFPSFNNSYLVGQSLKGREGSHGAGNVRGFFRRHLSSVWQTFRGELGVGGAGGAVSGPLEVPASP